MLGVEDVYALRRKVFAEGKSQRQVAREMGLARDTVRRYLATPVPAARKRERSRPVLEEVQPRLEHLLEEWSERTTAKQRITGRLASTARVITAAAAIMVVVFGSFVFEDDRGIKMFGCGLAVAVLLDATVVRLLLVPAAMELLGERNWWVPRWLDHLLPRLTIERTAFRGPLA